MSQTHMTSRGTCPHRSGDGPTDDDDDDDDDDNNNNNNDDDTLLTLLIKSNYKNNKNF